jgi:hypothetical protein
MKRDRALKIGMALLSWSIAALIVIRISADAEKIGAIVILAFVYMRFITRDVTLDHALMVGVLWLTLDVVAEMATTSYPHHAWFGLMGLPQHAAIRNLLLITWIGAPALFARRTLTT